jgi:hypothetical protein
MNRRRSAPKRRHKALGKAWWSMERWAGKQPRFGLPAAGQEVDMLWANMQLHMAADPQACWRSGTRRWRWMAL